VIDDLPQDIATPHGTITTIPYSVETNDIVIHALQHLPSEQFLKRCTDQFDRLYLEGASNARIMAISIHPYITGVPHRIKYLEGAARLCPRSRRRCTDDSQRDRRLVSR
jgi:allantoinase